jgi:hypothetical protein
MNDFLERWFPKTMRKYFYAAKRAGRTAGINEAIAMIYAEVKVLSNTKSDPKTQERLSELHFILSSLKNLR